MKLFELFHTNFDDFFKNFRKSLHFFCCQYLKYIRTNLSVSLSVIVENELALLLFRVKYFC